MAVIAWVFGPAFDVPGAHGWILADRPPVDLVEGSTEDTTLALALLVDLPASSCGRWLMTPSLGTTGRAASTDLVLVPGPAEERLYGVRGDPGAYGGEEVEVVLCVGQFGVDDWRFG